MIIVTIVTDAIERYCGNHCNCCDSILTFVTDAIDRYCGNHCNRCDSILTFVTDAIDRYCGNHCNRCDSILLALLQICWEALWVNRTTKTGIYSYHFCPAVSHPC